VVVSSFCRLLFCLFLFSLEDVTLFFVYLGVFGLGVFANSWISAILILLMVSILSRCATVRCSMKLSSGPSFWLHS